MSNQTTVTRATAAKKKLPIAGQSIDIDAELKAFEEAERKRLGLDSHVEQWVEDMVEPRLQEVRARQGHAAHRRPHRRAGLPHRGRPQGHRLQRADARLPDQRGLPGRQGVRQPRPVQPDVLHRRQPREVPDHAARQARHDAEGDRQEVRLPHRRRVRPVPLRHVRHRVPQGAPRRRLRRLPRHALPADRRPQAGHGRRGRPRAEPDVLLVDRQGASSPATCSTRSATASAPTRSKPARRTRALEKAKKILYEALESSTNIFYALWQCKPILGAVKVDKHAPEAEGQHHRRVLGDDDRGRRQLPAPAFLESEGAECDIQLVDRVAPLQLWEVVERHASSAPTSASTDDGEVRPRRRRPDRPSSKKLAIVRRAATSALRALLPDLRARRRASTATTCRT